MCKKLFRSHFDPLVASVGELRAPNSPFLLVLTKNWRLSQLQEPKPAVWCLTIRRMGLESLWYFKSLGSGAKPLSSKYFLIPQIKLTKSKFVDLLHYVVYYGR